MLPIRRILQPTDFSEWSEVAFRLATALARDYGASLIVLHVASNPAMVMADGIIPPAVDDAKDSLREELQRIQTPDTSVHLIHRLEEGNPASEILRVAQAVGADLIVMGTHGRRGLKRLLMGSVAEQVVRNSPCPVLTVKTPFPDWSPLVEESLEETVRS